MILNPPIDYAKFKVSPDDFIVKEIMAVNLTGRGEHLWLYIQKTNLNTAYLAKLLGLWANIPLSAVSYSGLKDRYAVTTQWFSLHLPKQHNKQRTQTIASFDSFAKKYLNTHESIKIIQHSYHQKKLQRGTHQYNAFLITLRNVQIKDTTALDTAICQLRCLGMPNFFGLQRFGADNVQKFCQFANKFHKKHKLTSAQSLLISSAKSHIFNEILKKRVLDDTWNMPICGDIFMLDGTQSLFTSDIDDDLIARINQGDIHPTAVMFGKNATLCPTDDCQTLENSIISDNQALASALSKIQTQSSRRALRVMIDELSSHWQDDTTLQLSFQLPTGAFATSLLAILCQTFSDESPSVLTQNF